MEVGGKCVCVCLQIGIYSKEVKKAIDKLNCGKAASVDGIPA